MTGAIPQLPLYAFMAGIVTPLPSTLCSKKVHYLALLHEGFTRKFYRAFSGVQATQMP